MCALRVVHPVAARRSSRRGSRRSRSSRRRRAGRRRSTASRSSGRSCGSQICQTVASPSAIDADQVADALAVLGVLADQRVDLAVVDDRRARGLRSGPSRVAYLIGLPSLLAVLGRVAVEAPDLLEDGEAVLVLDRLGLERVDAAVGAAEDAELASRRSAGRPARTSCSGGCAGSSPEASSPSSLPVFLSSTIRHGALGAGVSTWP